MIPQEDLMWMAGFFDGEGSISLSSDSRPKSKINFTLKVSITQVKEEPIKIFQKHFPATYTRWQTRYNGKTVFEWNIYGQTAKSFLETISPYLKNKSEQANLALEYLKLPWRNIGNSKGGIRNLRTKEQKIVDLNYGIKMARLNAKGSRTAEKNYTRLKDLVNIDLQNSTWGWEKRIRNKKGQFTSFSS